MKNTFHSVISGEHGFTAQGTLILSVHNWASIQIKKAVFASLRKKDETNLFDDSRMAFLKSRISKVAETVENVEVDALQVTRALAASLVLLCNHVAKPNPKTGKREEGLTKYLRPINVVKDECVAYAVSTSNDIATIKANFQTLSDGKPEKVVAELAKRRDARIASIEKKKAEEFEGFFLPYATEFWQAMKTFETTSDDELMDVVEEALADAGLNPWQYVIKCAVNHMDRQLKNELEGRRVFVDEALHAISKLYVAPADGRTA